MQTSIALFLYVFLLLFSIPIVILGSLLKPKIQAKPTHSPPTPAKLSKQIKKGGKHTQKALQTFRQFFLDATSCEQTQWLELIKELSLSPSLEIKTITEFQEELKQANPSLFNEIALTISVALKNRK
ncbi:hypothetical protein [Helicobacter pametensis]|nr:hypothetical protein [Helicobacter pametensis]